MKRKRRCRMRERLCVRECVSETKSDGESGGEKQNESQRRTESEDMLTCERRRGRPKALRKARMAFP